VPSGHRLVIASISAQTDSSIATIVIEGNGGGLLRAEAIRSS
jgi:hypothetical protein